MVGQVAQPVLVSVREEKDRELNIFRKMIRFTSFLSFPILFGLALVAREFILCTIGEQWLECVPLLQILCLSGAFMPLYTLYQNLVISHGRSDINMWLNIGQIAVQMAVILLFYRQGITVMVMAYTIFNILWLAVWQPFAKRIIGLRFLPMAKDIAPFAMIAAVVMLVTHYVTLPITSLWLLLFTRIALAAALYYGMMRLLHVAILNECLQFIRKK
jgi:O-antigen/teichoic acid export membrane protein